MKKTVWILNHYAGDTFFDKGGRHYWFAKYLRVKGYSPVVFCSNSNHVSGDLYFRKNDLWHRLMAEEIEVPYVFVKARTYRGNGMQRVRNMLDFYFNVKKVAIEYAAKYGSPDIIVASSVHPLTLVAGIQLACHFKTKCICEIRDLWPEAIFAYGWVKEKSLIGAALKAGEHWIYRKADALIFTKEGDTDYLKENNWTEETGGDIPLTKCYYINNGVDLPEYVCSVDTNQHEDVDLLEKNVFRVVYAGAIRPVNNVDNLVLCAKLFASRADYSDVKFLIYGEGSERVRLQKQAEDEGLNNLIFKGFVQKTKIPFILSKASVNILNYSQAEYNWTRGNSSNKLFEYMASGKPVISTVKMGYSIINRYHCGLELDACTPEELANAIIKLHDLPKAQYDALGANARRGAEDFDFTNLTQKLIDIIENL